MMFRSLRYSDDKMLTQEFMADVRFRSVVGLGGVAHVLCGVERLKCQAVQKVAGMQ